MMRALMLALMVAFATPALAEAPAQSDSNTTETRPIPDPVMFKSDHSGTFGGSKMTYRVEAGETQIKNDEGKPAASLFTISYIADKAGPSRPGWPAAPCRRGR